MKNLFRILAIAALSFQAFAVDNLESDEKKAVKKIQKGDDMAITGSSKGLGYMINFKDSKDAYIHFWGLARFYAYPASATEKFAMPYFRMNIDAQKDKNWSFHARLDYGDYIKGQYYKLNNKTPDDKDNGARTIYFARAYTTYEASKNLKFHIGRLLNQTVRHDVFDDYTAFDYDKTYHFKDLNNYSDSAFLVGEGVQAEYKIGNWDLLGMVSYVMANDQNSGKDEKFFYGFRIGHTTHNFLKTGSIELGIGASTTSHDEMYAQFVDITPDFTFKLNNFYLLDQAMFRTLVSMRDAREYPIGSYPDKWGDPVAVYLDYHSGDYDWLVRNHIEMGYRMPIMGKNVTLDSYLASAFFDGEEVHDFGLEAQLEVFDRFFIQATSEYQNVFNSKVERPDESSNFLKRIDYNINATYYF